MRGCAHHASRAPRSGTVRFVVISDTHINTGSSYDADLAAAIADAASFSAHHVIALGDLSEKSGTPLARYASVVGSNLGSATLHQVIGTHDLDDDGVPNGTNDAFVASTLGMSGPPFWWHRRINENGLVVLLVGTEQIEYAGEIGGVKNANVGVAVGDRIGVYDGDPVGGSYRRFGPSQLAWLRSVLAANHDVDCALVLAHEPPVMGRAPTDYASLSHELRLFPRPSVLLCGHSHSHPRTISLVGAQTALKFPEMQLCDDFTTGGKTAHPWTRFEIGFDGSAVTFALAEVRNVGDYGTWTEVAPFTKGPTP